MNAVGRASSGQNVDVLPNDDVCEDDDNVCKDGETCEEDELEDEIKSVEDGDEEPVDVEEVERGKEGEEETDAGRTEKGTAVPSNEADEEKECAAMGGEYV